ncbi:probable E3 ubiquitin-protein ligase LUL4 [Aristolochia californica]|uniref:probable E3 ubiquitin-protein ligase LUL4 n=1 Tax=Aristolochia californica TaxID=171875 RepID=UPI0035DAF900
MNLAMALAAERDFRAAAEQQRQQQEEECATPLRVSLMRLLEEGEDAAAAEKEERGESERSSVVCCVCMGRRKGSAFIPCGHTFCRVCSRELWLNRGSCPLCNRSILDILDIF